MSQEKKVWVSEFGWSFIPRYPFSASYGDLFDYREYRLNELKLNRKDDEELRAHNEETYRKLRQKQRVGPFNRLPVLPDKLWIETGDKKAIPKKMANIFNNGAGMFFDETFAEILSGFRLGENALTPPIQIYDLKSGELWRDETYYFLNVCEKRRYMLPPKAMEVEDMSFKYSISRHDYQILNSADGVVTVEASATECDVDLWHDPLLRFSHFMSDGLGRALAKANPKRQPADIFFCTLV